MATLEENLRTFLLADTTLKQLVGTRVYVNDLPQGKDDFAFLYQSGSADEAALDDSAGAPFRYRFVLECVSTSQGRMRSISNRAQAILNKHRGGLGDDNVQAIFAAEMDDDYVPRSVADTSAYKFASLQVEVVP